MITPRNEMLVMWKLIYLKIKSGLAGAMRSIVSYGAVNKMSVHKLA